MLVNPYIARACGLFVISGMCILHRYLLYLIHGNAKRFRITKEVGRKEEGNQMQEVERMTDKQAEYERITTRLDELDRLEEATKDPATLDYIKERKKELRNRLDTL